MWCLDLGGGSRDFLIALVTTRILNVHLKIYNKVIEYNFEK